MEILVLLLYWLKYSFPIDILNDEPWTENTKRIIKNEYSNVNHKEKSLKPDDRHTNSRIYRKLPVMAQKYMSELYEQMNLNQNEHLHKINHITCIEPEIIDNNVVYLSKNTIDKIMTPLNPIVRVELHWPIKFLTHTVCLLDSNKPFYEMESLCYDEIEFNANDLLFERSTKLQLHPTIVNLTQLFLTHNQLYRNQSLKIDIGFESFHSIENDQWPFIVVFFAGHKMERPIKNEHPSQFDNKMLHNIESFGDQACSLIPVVIDFVRIGKSNIIAPTLLKINACLGTCQSINSLFSIYTNNAQVKRTKAMVDESLFIQQPCCSSLNYGSSVFHVLREKKMESIYLERVIAVDCACQ